MRNQQIGFPTSTNAIIDLVSLESKQLPLKKPKPLLASDENISYKMCDMMNSSDSSLHFVKKFAFCKTRLPDSQKL